MAGDYLSNHNAFFRTFVGQHGAANQIANGINARHVGGTLVIDKD
jgi:hypothetical protein